MYGGIGSLRRIFASECSLPLKRAEQHTQTICLGYVLMPDHLHVLVQQTTDGAQISELLRHFKRSTARVCKPSVYPSAPLWLTPLR